MLTMQLKFLFIVLKWVGPQRKRVIMLTELFYFWALLLILQLNSLFELLIRVLF